jgi:hypothetical protein
MLHLCSIVLSRPIRGLLNPTCWMRGTEWWGNSEEQQAGGEHQSMAMLAYQPERPQD